MTKTVINGKRVKVKGLWQYEESYNPIIDYHNQIQDGTIVTSNKVKATVAHLVREIELDEGRYTFSIELARRPVTFIENFIQHYKGVKSGEPFILELWQLVIIYAFFGFVDKETMLRKYRELLLILARKNGKSSLASAIAVYLQYGDGESAPNLVSVATQKDQAKLVWEVSKAYVNKSPLLRERAKTLINEIKTPFNDGSFKPLASASDSLDGLDLHVACIDELHAIKDKNLYDVVVDGMSARLQPVTLITTTAGTVRDGIFDLKYDEASNIINGYTDSDGYKDDTILPFVYELDNVDEWREEANWAKANPAIGTIKNAETLATKVYQARNNPQKVNNLLVKEFNVRSSNDNAWMTFDDINNEATYELSELDVSYAIGGVDLSKTTDLTAACVRFKVPDDDTIYYKHMYWMPSDALEKRVEEDNVPYDVWRDLGWLRESEGSSVNYKDVTKWFEELRDEYGIYTLYVGYDAWNGTYWAEEMANVVGADNMVIVRQGAQTLSTPMYQLEASIKAKKVNYENNPITKWCLTNTHVKIDDNGNIKPTKSRRGKRQRIDGLACMLNAEVVYRDKQTDYDNMI